MNPFIIEESQAHYQEHVDAAEAWRLERAARVATPGLADRVRAAIGDRLGDADDSVHRARPGQPLNGLLSADFEYGLTGCGQSVIANRRSAPATTT